jgi:sarcosine oxidase
MGRANREGVPKQVTKSYDIAVVGAGVFGAWTAWHLAARGQRVLLLDAFGPANARASSGGESRIIRMGYGRDAIYTQSAQNAYAQWQKFFASTGHDDLFYKTGVLWLAAEDDERVRDSAATLTKHRVLFEQLDRTALEARYPQISLDGIAGGLLEPESGVLMARRAVAAVVEDAVRAGVEYRTAAVATPRSSGKMVLLRTSTGESIVASAFVFACGAWLGKIFPDVLGGRIFPSRQEVFFFGIPPGDLRFSPPALPTFLFQEELSYGMPDLESRGLKIALDAHGECVDPDTQSRIVSLRAIEQIRAHVARRFPALHNAPIVETRVCQYENTSSGDFLIDRHPEMDNVWFAGGGSGHGFKHGPAIGEYVTHRMLDNAESEPRFSLATKDVVQHRAVY